MSKKKTPPPLKVKEGAQQPEASQAELLTEIRSDTAATTRALARLAPHPRPSRSLDAPHFIRLAQSISVLGLIQPIVVDIDQVVVAGSHRYTALQLLATAPAEREAYLASLGVDVGKLKPSAQKVLDALPVNPPAVDFDRIPIRILPISHKEQQGQVLESEIAENERRRNYSSQEVKQLAERLRSMGYTFKHGRPAKGEQPALPMLSDVLGLSARQVQRILAEPSTPPESPPLENTTHVVFKAETKQLVKRLTSYHSKHVDMLNAEIARQIVGIIDVLKHQAFE